MPDEPTISNAIADYLSTVELSRSKNTHHTYLYALEYFSQVLLAHNIDPAHTPISQLSEKAVQWLTLALKVFAPSTERLYLTAVSNFYRYLAALQLSTVNLPLVQQITRSHSRRAGARLPQFPQGDIESVIEYAINLVFQPYENGDQHLINLRDRAFILTLADTGLRVHEACKLRRGDIEWHEQKARVIGKGDTEAVVRFSSRAVDAIRDYLSARQSMDGASGQALASLPVFIRHDKGAGSPGRKKKTRISRPITTATGRNIIAQRVREALGEKAAGTITPHSFRHYFVTTVLRGSGGNLKIAQELARHKNIAVTQRYAHLSDDELDRSYNDIFEDGQKHMDQ